MLQSYTIKVLCQLSLLVHLSNYHYDRLWTKIRNNSLQIENINRIKHKEVIDKSIKINAKNLKSLFHYTSNTALEAILCNETLRFSNIFSLNDYDEVTVSINLLIKQAQELGIALPTWYTPETVKEENIYVCCFSLDSDSQAMWNYYTKDLNNKGFNLEFDCKKLVRSILKYNPYLDGCEMSFGKIEYMKNDKSRYLQQMHSVFKNSFDYMFNNAILCLIEGNIPSDQEQTKEIIANLKSAKEQNKRNIEYIKPKIYGFNNKTHSFEPDMTHILFFIKNETYKYENEYRIGIYIPSDIKNELIKKNIIKTQLFETITRTYMDLKFSLDAIKGITVSPTSNYSEALKFINNIEIKKNLPKNSLLKKVIKSGCTSRII